jgi:N-carbamoyl-L-amino-acid hydrolase
MAMIFVPSVGGISHAPAEYTAPADLANGVNVLLRTLLAIDRGAPGARPDRQPAVRVSE